MKKNVSTINLPTSNFDIVNLGVEPNHQYLKKLIRAYEAIISHEKEMQTISSTSDDVLNVVKVEVVLNAKNHSIHRVIFVRSQHIEHFEHL